MRSEPSTSALDRLDPDTAQVTLRVGQLDAAARRELALQVARFQVRVAEIAQEAAERGDLQLDRTATLMVAVSTDRAFAEETATAAVVMTGGRAAARSAEPAVMASSG